MIQEIIKDPQKIIRRRENSKLPEGTHFSKNLTVMRKMAGLSQTEAARFIGVPEKSYQSWEYGYSKPGKIEFLMKICEAFQMYDLYAMMSRPLKTREIWEGALTPANDIEEEAAVAG